jgi:hypothetical protein
MRQWRHEEPSRHGAPLRFGSATPEQQHDLFIDFAPATVAVVVVTVPLVEVSVPPTSSSPGWLSPPF